MQTQIKATVIDGTLKLDQPVELPNQSRVTVTVQPISECQKGWKEALESLQQLIEERPIHSGGRHFTREELHERR